MAIRIDDITGTFSNGAIHYDGIKLDVNNVNSAVTSTLINLLENSNSKFIVETSGNTYIAGRATLTGGIYANGTLGNSGQFLTSTGNGLVWTEFTDISIPNTEIEYVYLSSVSANGSLGTNTHVLTTNGNTVYWAAAVNTDATYVWSNNHTFQNNVIIQNNLTVSNTLTLKTSNISSTEGHSYLPNGLKLNYGTAIVPGSGGSNTISFNSPFSSNAYIIFDTQNILFSYTKDDISFYNSDVSLVTTKFLAIGV